MINRLRGIMISAFALTLTFDPEGQSTILFPPVDNVGAHVKAGMFLSLYRTQNSEN